MRQCPCGRNVIRLVLAVAALSACQRDDVATPANGSIPALESALDVGELRQDVGLGCEDLTSSPVAPASAESSVDGVRTVLNVQAGEDPDSAAVAARIADVTDAELLTADCA